MVDIMWKVGRTVFSGGYIQHGVYREVCLFLDTHFIFLDPHAVTAVGSFLPYAVDVYVGILLGQ